MPRDQRYPEMRGLKGRHSRGLSPVRQCVKPVVRSAETGSHPRTGGMPRDFGCKPAETDAYGASDI
jgi:hypothetical protein